MARGLTQQLRAIGTYSDGTTADVTSQVTWSSSDGTVATVAAVGLATGRVVGVAVVTATAGQVSGHTTLSVTAAVLQSIVVMPLDRSIPRGLNVQYTAVGVFSDGTTPDITSQVSWGSSDTATATVTSSGGLATGVAAGLTTVTATSGAVSGSAMLSVVSATLQSIALTPAAPSVASGFTRQLTATGSYSDGTSADLTTQVTWASTNTAVATVAATGLATGTAAGGATITATSGAVSASATLSVTSATLQSIAVTPTDPSIAVGQTSQFKAVGTFSDGTSADISSQVVWTSSTPAANVTGSGLATAVGAGGTIITATSGLVSGHTTLTVTSAVLLSVVVTPLTLALPKGLAAQYTALGLYSDGTSADISSHVTWASTNTSVALVTPAGGLVTAVAPGGATITATSGALSGGAGLSVTTATLRSITVTPAPAFVSSGSSRAFTANGTFSDGTSADVTSQVTWTSSNTSVANVVGGLATGGAAGTTTITALSGAISGGATLQVSLAPTPTFSVAGSNPINPGSTTTFAGTVCLGCTFSITPAASIAAASLVGTALSATSSALATSTTFTLSVTNQAGDSASQAATVGVNRPSIGSFDGPTSWSAGKGGIPLTASFGGGTGASATVVATTGTIGSTCTPASSTSSPQTFTCGAISQDTTYTLTVTLGSGAGSTAAATLVVKAAPTESTTPGIMPPRYGAAIAQLPNGKVLIAGGSTTADGSGAVNTAQIYDPATGTFAQAGQGAGCVGASIAMSSKRYLGTATVLPNGQVLLTGGTTDGTSANAQNTADVYDVAPDCFTALTGATHQLNWARFRHTATALPDGRVLIAGGTGTGGTALGIGELFDPTSAQFSQIANAMTSRTGATATLLTNGKVLIAGGTATAEKGDLFDYTAPTVFSSTTGSMQVARSQHTATLLGNGTVLFVGGAGAMPPSSAVNGAELYNPTTGVFTSVGGALGIGRFAHTATLLPTGTVLIAGGTTSSGFATSSTELFDPAGGFFSSAASMSASRTQGTAAILVNGTALVTGGSAFTTSGDLFVP